ncbi:MobP3 family relaxase [Caproiciproducens sp. LBM24188]
MPGARLILNARYFHIAKVGEKADGKHVMTKDAAMGLVNYVGTRESVVLNMPKQHSMDDENITALNLDPLNLKTEVAARPATHKQMKLLAELLHEFPEAKQSLEYQDFKANPTIGNATELISHAAEFGLGFAVDLGRAKNLVEYVGKRPGVDRVGEHGLFSSAPEVDIKKAQEEIANCKGNIWTHVISLRREDADALGYDTQKPWRDLIMQKIDIIAKASNIPVSELHWYAGMHNTTHHPHIHLLVFSDNPKSGKLTREGINQMKSEFSEVIFADERHHIYEHKDEMREGIKKQVDEILSEITRNAERQFSDKEMDTLCNKLLQLGNVLKNRPGKLQYGWIKDFQLRRQINDIMADLGKTPAIQELYRLYCEDHKELQGMYRNNPKDIGPLERQSEFQVIRNKIIREAVNLARAHESSLSSPLSYESLCAPLPSEKLDCLPADYEQSANWDVQDDFEPVEQCSSAEQRFRDCWNKAVNGAAKSGYELAKARYELARMYFYGKGVEQDYGQAMMWYGLAAESGHSFAKYELGKMYLYGIGIDMDMELGKEYCLEAYWDFRHSVEKAYGLDIGQYVEDGTVFEEGYSGCKDAAYLLYCLGRMEHSGEGIDRNYEKAFRWYRLAAQGGHIHSNYCMAQMYYGGEGVPQDYSEALHCYKAAAEGKDRYAYYALGRMFDTGTGVEQNRSAAASWFTLASKENVPYADYRLAQMCAAGQGMEQDTELSGILYRKALEEFLEQEKRQPNAADELRIAGMYLHGLGVDVNPKEAAKWLELCAEKEDPHAQYQLARMLQTGDGVMKNENRAGEFYTKAFQAFVKLNHEEPDDALQYKIGIMLEFGLGVKRDVTAAKEWYRMAADSGNESAAERLNQIHAMETGMAVNSVLSLFRALSQSMGDSIKDSTTHKYRQDRKLLQKQRERKIEHGHKYDDQEQAM